MIVKQIEFALENDGEWKITLSIFDDGSVTVDAEAEDDITPMVWRYEEVMVDNDNPTPTAIRCAIDAENERRQDIWLEGQYERRY